MNHSIIAASRLRRVELPFIITVNSGSSGSYTIPTDPSRFFNYNYDVTTSDGQNIAGNTGNLTISFPSTNTVYTIEISKSFPKMFINNNAEKLKFLSIEQFGIYGKNAPNQFRAFYLASNCVINATDAGSFEDVTEIINFFDGLSSVVSFPTINTINVTNWNASFRGMINLLKFPLLNTSSGINFSFFLFGNASLVSFGKYNFQNASRFSLSWYNCISLVNFDGTSFENCPCINYKDAFQNTNLSQTSIDSILTSINSNSTSNGFFKQTGGSAPSSIGEAAITAMRSRGWTITVTGGF